MLDDLQRMLAHGVAVGLVRRDKAHDLGEAGNEAVQQVLSERRAVSRTLRSLCRLGLLDRFIPGFSEIMRFVPPDQAHRYTVGEHSLKIIEHLEDLRRGSDPPGQRFSDLLRDCAHFDMLALAALLHDVGKRPATGPSHSERSAAAAQAVAARLELAPDKRELLELLVRHHLFLVRTSRLQDLKAPGVIASVAEKFPSVDALRHLYVFTYVDTRAVAEKSWTSIDYRDLEELYQKVQKQLTGEVAEEAHRPDSPPPRGHRPAGRRSRDPPALRGDVGELRPEHSARRDRVAHRPGRPPRCREDRPGRLQPSRGRLLGADGLHLRRSAARPLGQDHGCPLRLQRRHPEGAGLHDGAGKAGRARHALDPLGGRSALGASGPAHSGFAPGNAHGSPERRRIPAQRGQARAERDPSGERRTAQRPLRGAHGRARDRARPAGTPLLHDAFTLAQRISHPHGQGRHVVGARREQLLRHDPDRGADTRGGAGPVAGAPDARLSRADLRVTRPAPPAAGA
ncbi:MAG: hypothetical protein DMG07_10975 [Acidobacteria bacterium]|nr:MAG: hypothetical protein DMG07_10975 [Acidobacteriota bacterium]